MSEWFLEQQNNIKFYVKLGKNATETWAGEKLWRHQVFLSGKNSLKV
jgi:hypothetical protein